MAADKIFIIEENKQLNSSVFMLKVKGDASDITNAGQFCEILIEEKFLRRPLSVYEYGKDFITFVYKTVGDGTRILSTLRKGQRLKILSGLGNGFILNNNKKVMLIGGGIGTPPLYMLAKILVEEKIIPEILLGFNTKEDVILEEEFSALGLNTQVYTLDGSYKNCGYVTNGMKEDFYIYTCGPEPMLKAVFKKCKDGQFSLEARMGCGFGACMGCSIKTLYGMKRVCKEGPVFSKKELLW